MKKVLSLAFIAAVFLLGCSADGFFDPNNPDNISWGKVCKFNEECYTEFTKKECDEKGGEMIMRSQCPSK